MFRAEEHGFRSHLLRNKYILFYMSQSLSVWTPGAKDSFSWWHTASSTQWLSLLLLINFINFYAYSW